MGGQASAIGRATPPGGGPAGGAGRLGVAITTATTGYGYVASRRPTVSTRTAIIRARARISWRCGAAGGGISRKKGSRGLDGGGSGLVVSGFVSLVALGGRVLGTARPRVGPVGPTGLTRLTGEADDLRDGSRRSAVIDKRARAHGDEGRAAGAIPTAKAGLAKAEEAKAAAAKLSAEANGAAATGAARERAAGRA